MKSYALFSCFSSIWEEITRFDGLAVLKNLKYWPAIIIIRCIILNFVTLKTDSEIKIQFIYNEQTAHKWLIVNV